MNRFLSLLLLIPMFVFCTPDNIPDDPDTDKKDTTEQQQPLPPSDNVITPEEPTVELATEIKNGDRILACNPNVEKFLSEVTYPDRDYSYTKIIEYYG